jgi:HlyD family secretion protein
VELIVPEDLPYKEFVVFEVAEKSVGSTMQPGEPLFKLVPVGVPMEAEVEIQGKDIARIKVATEAEIESGKFPFGADARVKLHSFPYQKHGTLDGAVRAISEGSFEKQLPGGGSSGITTYKARIQLLDPEKLENVPDNFRLMPGMAVTVEIKVGRRRVIEYFLYPLLRYLDESIREP